jgi:hypothetical protein
MNRSQAQTALLKCAVALCAVMFVCVCVSILDARPDSESTVVERAMRLPASLPNLLHEKKISVIHPSFQLWEPACLEKTSKFEPFAANAQWLRISAAICNEDSEIQTSLIHNETNHFDATTFAQSNFQFTSDLIPLTLGQNKLHAEIVLQNGDRLSYDWVVNRNATASN